MSFRKEKMSVSNYKGNKVKFINFNTRWCYYSKILQPEWNKLMKYYKNHKRVKIYDIKCEDEKNKDKCKKFKIKVYPTIIKIKNNKKEKYNGKRKLKNFINFIEN